MKPMSKFFLLSACTLAAAFIASGCGVRGRPQPPLTPAELGHGQPSFKRATEEYAFPNVPAPEASPVPKADGDGQ